MRTVFWSAAAVLAAASAAAAQTPAETPAAASAAQPGELTKEQADKILAQCSSKRFESTAEFEVEGKMRRTGVRVCALPNDSDAAWLARLQKAVAQVEGQQSLPQSVREKLATDLRNEIARLNSAKKKPPLAAADALVPTVPPMPTPLPPQAPIVLGSTAIPKMIAPPRISLRCLDEGGPRDFGVDCGDEIRRDTILALEADEDVTAPTMVRFVRKGSLRGSVRLGALRQGQLVRLRLPLDVCKGVVRSKLEIEIESASSAPGRVAAAATNGPYTLRC